MFKIKTKISVKDNELIQLQYINSHYIVTEINGKKLLFTSGNLLFSVDVENKTLKKIDISSQVDQINKLKAMLGELKEESIDEQKNIAGFNSKKKKVFNNENSAIKLLMDVYIANIPGLNETIYPEFLMFDQSKQLVHFNLQPNEIIASMTSEISSKGNLVQKQSIELVSIECDLNDNEEFNKYLTYSEIY